jgi:hypothetical protein
MTFVTGRWFSPVSTTSKTDRQDITEILLKVALNTIKSKPNYIVILTSLLSNLSVALPEKTNK